MFPFGCCMLFCICTGQARVTRSDPELLDASLSCDNELLPRLQGALTRHRCAEACCKPTQALPRTEKERNSRSPPSKSSDAEDPLLQTHTVKQRRDPAIVGSCKHTHGQCLMNLRSPHSCFFAPKGSPCVGACTVPEAAAVP